MNSRSILVGGISLSGTGTKYDKNFKSLWASLYSGQFFGTEAKIGSAWLLNTANSISKAELDIMSAFS